MEAVYKVQPDAIFVLEVSSTSMKARNGGGGSGSGGATAVGEGGEHVYSGPHVFLMGLRKFS